MFWPWLVGGAAALLVLGKPREAQAAAPSSGTGRDLDALADMLITETSFARDQNEMAQIVFVALNRAQRNRVPIATVVDPRYRGTKPVPWNTSERYLRLFDAARDNPRWDAARSFAAQVLGGAYRNLGYVTFAHPTGLSAPPCASGRVEISTFAGPRCIGPTHGVATTGGTRIGGALFA